MQIKVATPAKINLTLEVLNKREDGFHNIKSIMQTINLFDYLTISVEKSEKFEIVLSGTSEEIPYNEKNLVHKAIILMKEELLNVLDNYKISVYIEKNIPVSAGLAGGSTNAAGVLFGVNELLNKPLNKKVLHSLCAKLGSDLNFCLEGGKQMTTGRGEILEKLVFEEFSLSLIKPIDLGISAKEAYTKFAQRGGNGYLNNLEGAVIEDYPQLQKIKELYPDSIMSGSGSTYFIIEKSFEPMEGYWIKNNLKTIDSGVKIVYS